MAEEGTPPAALGAPAAPAAPAFPANTPVEQMTADQQAGYWKAQSQKHQGRSESNYALLRQIGVTSADDAATVKSKLDEHAKAEDAKASEIEKREKAAGESANAAADAKYRPMLAETAFRVAIGDGMKADEIGDFIAETNMSSFIKDDGTVDTAKVIARVARLVPAKGNQQQSTPPRGPFVPAHTPPAPAASGATDGALKYLASKGITPTGV